MKIDISEWKQFRVGELFNIHPTKAYKENNAILLNGGDNKVVVNSAYNNGVGGTSSFATTEKGNMITFSDTVDANTIFYQKDPFVGYAHVQGLYPIGEYADKWSEYSLLYFAVLFRRTALSKGFDYGNKFRRDIATELIINIPVYKTGEPNWEYMENYMKSIENKVKDKLSKLYNIVDTPPILIQTVEWEEFKIGDLFNIVKGTRLTKSNMKDGNIRFVGSSSLNNGETHRISNNEHVHPDNTITVCYNGSVGETFYQDEPYWASDDVNVLYPKFEMTKYIAWFMCPIIKKVGTKYAFINKWKQEDMKNDIIRLPATLNGFPDYKYMSEYMKAIETLVNEKAMLLA